MTMSVSTIYSDAQRLLNDCSGVSSQVTQKMDTQIVNEIIEMENERILNEEKVIKSQQGGLPDNPILYNSSHAKIWISHFLNGCDIANAGEIICRLDRPDLGINGATLAHWNVEDYKRAFGDCGDIMHHSFKSWVDHFKKNQSFPAHPQNIETNTTPSYTPLEHQTLRSMGFDDNLSSLLVEPVGEPGVSLSVPVIPSPTLSFVSSIPSDYSSPTTCSSGYSSANGLWDETPIPTMGYNLPNHFNYEPTPWFNLKQEHMTSDGDSEGSVSSVTLDSEPDVTNKFDFKPLPAITHLLNRNPNRQVVQSQIQVGPQAPIKRKRGRPRKPKPEKPKRTQPILYKFILMHLEIPDSRKYVEWVNRREGIFRFHSAQKDNFAKKWGEHKRNREPMTYQNMARALRNYTKGKRKVMERVKRKLHYKFCTGFVPTV